MLTACRVNVVKHTGEASAVEACLPSREALIHNERDSRAMRLRAGRPGN
jgi:hypothetical protein